MTTPAITPSGQLSAAATLEEKLALPMFLATLAFVILVSVTLRFLEKGELILESWPPFMLMYIPLWSLFILESAFFFWFYWKMAAQANRIAISGLIWCILVPPLRMGRHSLFYPKTVVLPFLGRLEVNEALNDRVVGAFHRPMLFITILILPVIVGETFWLEEVANDPLLTNVLDLALIIIWAAFVVEFIILAGLAKNWFRYILAHPIDFIVILLPFAAFLRGGRLFRLTRLIRFYRGILFLQFLSRWEKETKLIDRMIGLVATILVLIVAGWFAFFHSQEDTKTIKSIYYFTILAESGSLGKDSPINLAGVKIGQITSIRLRPDGSILAELGIYHNRRSFITQDSYFQMDDFLALAAVVGKSALNLIPGPKGARTIPEKEFIQTVKKKSLEHIIRNLNLEMMGSKINTIVANTERITSHIQEISHRVQKDQASIFASLRHLEKITGDISTTTDNLPQILNRFGNSVATLNQAVAMVDSIIVNQRKAVNATTHDAHAAIIRLNQSLQQLSIVLKRVSAVMAIIETNSATLPQMLQDGSNSIENAYNISRKINNRSWLGKSNQPVDALAILPIHSPLLKPLLKPSGLVPTSTDSHPVSVGK